MGSEIAARQGPQPINIWMESLRSSLTADLDEAERLERTNKDEAILALLGRLALVYWRPDFAPSQAKQLYLQYLEDLRDFPMSEIAEAIQKYRRDGENRFFPTCGQLRDLIAKPPSWDVISRKDHLHALHIRAREEMAAAVGEARKRIGAAAPQQRIAAE